MGKVGGEAGGERLEVRDRWGKDRGLKLKVGGGRLRLSRRKVRHFASELDLLTFRTAGGFFHRWLG
jgi:hypothetical protein